MHLDCPLCDTPASCTPCMRRSQGDRPLIVAPLIRRSDRDSNISPAQHSITAMARKKKEEQTLNHTALHVGSQRTRSFRSVGSSHVRVCVWGGGSGRGVVHGAVQSNVTVLLLCINIYPPSQAKTQAVCPPMPACPAASCRRAECRVINEHPTYIQQYTAFE